MEIKRTMVKEVCNLIYYAQIDENNICIGVSQHPEEINREDLIKINSYDISLLRKIWQDSEWIENPNPIPEPEPSPEPTSTDELKELMLDMIEGQVTLFEMQLASSEAAL